MLNDNPEGFIIYGAGGFAREVAWLINSKDENGSQVVCFADDDHHAYDEIIYGIPYLSSEAALLQYSNAAIVIAIGNPLIRRGIYMRLREQGRILPDICASSTQIGTRVTFAGGSVICAQSVLTTDIQVGTGVQINLNCTIGHDVKLGNFTTLAPGVHISGNVHVGEGVYIGTGATIINGTSDRPLIIGDNAIIGAQACVVRNVPPDTTVVGVPAKEKG